MLFTYAEVRDGWEMRVVGMSGTQKCGVASNCRNIIWQGIVPHQRKVVTDTTSVDRTKLNSKQI